MHRLFSVTIDHDQIAKWEKDLDRLLALFNFEAITGLSISTKKFASELKGNAPISVLQCRPIEPPSRPSMFHGRNSLVAELTNLVVILNDEHLALIGPGGIEKSSYPGTS